MKVRLSMSLFLLITGVILLFPEHQASAANAVARITSFKGEVVILSDTKAITVSKAGSVLNEGDSVQTKQGEVEITFHDGAIMRLSPFTNAMIQEREEESGWWLFKSSSSVRRLTVFVGKLFFQSGASQRKNFLQTPTAVCGLRGSSAWGGTDTQNNFLEMISGDAEMKGAWLQGVFQNPGLDAAIKSEVFRAIDNAIQQYAAAQQSGSALDMAKAEMIGLQAIKAAAEELKNNPDENVSTRAAEALTATEARIAEKQSQIDAMPTTTGGTTTSAGETTTSTGPTTTTTVELTTTQAELTTTATLTPPTTTPTIPLTTTTRRSPF